MTHHPDWSRVGPQLLEACQRLVNEVSGVFGYREEEIRQAIGHTNYGCVTDKLERARAAIAAVKETGE